MWCMSAQTGSPTDVSSVWDERDLLRHNAMPVCMLVGLSLAFISTPQVCGLGYSTHPGSESQGGESLLESYRRAPGKAEESSKTGSTPLWAGTQRF